MADKEINIKVTANTDDAKKGIAEVTNELEKMSTSGSGKAADELDKVTEAADKAGDATDKLVSSWEAYKQNVRDAEAEVRKLNATQFENAEQRDAAINALGDKLDELVYDGKAIEDAVKAIGISPEALQGFDSITATLNRANKEFEIALNYKEKLLSQPAAPDNALVTTNPWEEGPDGGGPAEFKARMEEMRAELEAYAAQMGNAIAANDQMKSALEAELASLDKSSAGYAEQKKLLEGLISACDSYAVSSETQRQSIQKQKDSLDELNKETLKSENWEEGLKSLDKYGEGVVATSLKVQKSVGSQIAIQNRYENAVLSAQQKELKGQVKLQAQMETAGKSREELIRLVEEYGKALANAQTKEEYEAAAAGLTAARKQLTLITREATLTGAAMLGAQTSVQGLTSAIGRLGVTGRLTFKGLTEGVKLFAKSTLVLAGIQFAWEALSKIYEKVKGDLFGVANAEEIAAEKAKQLADATREAGQAAIEAGMALGDKFYNDEIRAKSEKNILSFTRLKDELQANVTAMQNLTKSRINDMETAAAIAGDDMMLKKLQLENDFINGKIDATEKAIALKRLESDVATAADNLKLEKAREELELQKQINAEALKTQAAANRKVAELRQKGENLMTPEEIKVYEKQRKSIERELFELAESDRTGGDAQKAKNQSRRIQLWGLLDRLEDKRNASGRNTVAEYEAWKMEYEAAVSNASELDKKYLAENAKMYDQVQSFERLKKDTERRADTRKKVNDIEEKNINSKKKQADKDKKNQEKINAIKETIHSLSIAELRKQEADLKAQAQKAKNSRNRDRISARAAVYSDEYQRRIAEGKAAANKVGEGLDATGRQQKVIATAQKLAARAGSGRSVSLERVAGVLEQALNTSGSEDDVAAQRLYEVVNKMVTVTDKNARQMRILKNKYQALKQKIANLDS